MAIRKRFSRLVIVRTVLIILSIASVSSFVVTVGVAAGNGPVQKGKRQQRQRPDVVRMVGPVSQDRNLSDLPEIPPTVRDEAEPRLTRHPLAKTPSIFLPSDPVLETRTPWQPAAMPTPLFTFPGMTLAGGGCNCLPPDPNGDVGPNHYIQSVNQGIEILDKSGAVLSGPTTYNSFFSLLAGTPCASLNDGDGVVFYDHQSDRWVVSDIAFPNFPGSSFYECIGVSRTSDPVAGGWWLYAMQTDPSNPTYFGDYPKFGLWPDAYYMSVNMFSNPTTFTGVRVYALDRGAMINGEPANTIAFTITPENGGDAYSLLPATFRTGSPPPAGRPEYFMAIDSPATAGMIQTQVYAWRFHVDFGTPANSTFGLGAGHTPNGTITVDGFVDAFTDTEGFTIVPQNGTTQKIDTLGDKLMYPLVYQNLGGTESIYSAQTVNNDQGGTGPSAIRWHQFNVTGSTIPAVPTQQQTFNNDADGLWRSMPSINVDSQGNMAIGYSTSSATSEPSIRYAGRLAGDPANTLAQGEAVMQPSAGHQTHPSGRWGDYSSTFVDPADNCTFWHTNEYYSATASYSWNTRIGLFQFPGCSGPGTPTPTATATPTPTVTATATATNTPTATPTPITVFRNSTPICTTLGNPGSPYPSTIKVAGGPLQIGALRVTFYDLYHVIPDNLDALLVGPLGQKFILMGDAGDAIPIDPTAPVTLMFTDAAGQVLPDSSMLTSGMFEPTNWESPVSDFPAPAPPGPYNEPGSAIGGTGPQTLNGTFGFSNSNGVWSLYVRDDGGTYTPVAITGCINGGWSLEFLPLTAADVSLAGRVTTADGRGIRNAHVVISGNSLPESRTVTTGSFGYYSFDGLTAGQTYVVTVNSQRYTFSVPSRVITLVDNVVDADFVANAGSR